MNPVVTSKEEILKTSRELIQQQGWTAINIRSVAAACGVSVGSIYNYFDSKSALISAVVESIWCEIFRRPEDGAVFQDTLACVTWMYERMEQGCRQYPGFFTLHSLGFFSFPGGGQVRRAAKDAADLAAHSGGAVRRFESGQSNSPWCLYRGIYSGEICGRPVFLDAVRFFAAGLRPFRRAGDRPQDAVLNFREDKYEISR